MIKEEQLEHFCLNGFQAIGHETVYGYDLGSGYSPERSDYRQIVLFDTVWTQSPKLNPYIFNSRSRCVPEVPSC